MVRLAAQQIAPVLLEKPLHLRLDKRTGVGPDVPGLTRARLVVDRFPGDAPRQPCSREQIAQVIRLFR